MVTALIQKEPALLYGMTRIANIGLWVAILTLFTSYTTHEDASAMLGDSPIAGNYSIRATGDFNVELTGGVAFEIAQETASDGTPFATLKLNLKGNDGESHHDLGFLISQQNQSEPITAGTYRVPGSIDGFLNYFDGVFGFANVKKWGELPFFAQRGKISIRSIEADYLQGSMEIRLQNANGKTINLTGNFTAIRQNEKK
ncbi:hypothetical protein WIW50_05450 [Flavobacteriaceae bacterium 3-367]|uniref:hypothetical protein n=1 Tax=Eudoraea algarum TaxID=3417568 RepID=UPI0032692EF7